MSTPTVVAVRTRRVVVALHTPFVTALRRTTTTETVLVEVEDSDGLVGRGESPQVWQVTGESLAGAEACLAGPLSAAVVGAPAVPQEVWPRLSGAVVGNHGAKAAVDVALHDLAARRAGVTLAAHLGGPSGAVEVVTDVTLAAGDAPTLASAARKRAAEGFGVVKMKVGAGPSAASDVSRVAAVRAAIGPDVGIRLDANQGWRADEAVRAIRDMEDAGLDVELVEQPVPARDLDALAFVTHHVETPVMADESVFGLDDLVAVLRSRAAPLVNVKLAKCGGLTPALELLRVARAHGLGTMVGSMMESHVGIAAAGALAAADARALADLDAAWWAEASPYAGGPSYDGGRLLLPDAPGHGVTGVREAGSDA
ncbi:MAG: dipeptide epimerase [Nocardioides sp.]|nr:dipeptide epimerase [Nocardioides sp.]